MLPGLVGFVCITMTFGFRYAYQHDYVYWKYLVAWVVVFVGALLVALVLTMIGQMIGQWLSVLFVMGLYIYWVYTLITEITRSGARLAALTHLAPILFVSVVFVLRRVSLLRSITLLLPLTLVILFVPLFSADLWSAAARLDRRQVLLLGAVTIVPVVLFLRGRLHGSVQRIFVQTARKLSEDEGTISRAAIEIHKKGRSDPLSVATGGLNRLAELAGLANPEKHLDPFVANVVKSSFTWPTAATYAKHVSSKLESSFKRQINWRLTAGVPGIFAALSCYIYLLAVLVIDVRTAEAWTQRAIVSFTVKTPAIELPRLVGGDPVRVPAMDFALPGGSYVLVSILLGVVATAIFFAFVLTQEDYKRALTDTLLHSPIERCLLIAIPYLHMQAAGSRAELPYNDSFEHAYPIDGPRGTVVGSNEMATKDPAEPAHAGNDGGRSVWYRWKAPASTSVTIDTAGSDFDTLLAVYRGSSIEKLEPVAANDDVGFQDRTSRVNFMSEADAEYRIAVDGYKGAKGTIVLNWQPPAANDDFANPQVISGLSGTVRDDNVGATKQAGEPDHAGKSGGRSVWYRWKAPASGSVTIDTKGSRLDTLLAVYRGSSIEGLVPVAANDDAAPDNTTSRVDFTATKDTEYRIAVDGYNGAEGAIVLNWSMAPANDNVADARVLSGPNGTVRDHNVGATRQPGEPDHADNAGGRSVWYRWKAPASGSVTIDTKGSRLDTLLAVYRGSSIEGLMPVAANDDAAPDNTTSQVDFTATKDTEYRIAVDGYNGAEGAIVLNWSMAVPPTGSSTRSSSREGTASRTPRTPRAPRTLPPGVGPGRAGGSGRR